MDNSTIILQKIDDERPYDDINAVRYHQIISIFQLAYMTILFFPNLNLSIKSASKPHFTKNKFKNSLFYKIKLLVNFAIIVNSLVMLIQAYQGGLGPPYGTPIAIICNLASQILAMISEILQHKYEGKKSVILCLFWLISVLSSLLHVQNWNFLALYMSCLMLILNLFSEPSLDYLQIPQKMPRNKGGTYMFYKPENETTKSYPYVNDGFFSNLFFNWFSPLITYCQENVINIKELWSLNPVFSCKYTTEEIERRLKFLQSDDDASLTFIYLAIIKKYWPSFLLIVLLKIARIISSLTIPQIMKKLIQCADPEADKSRSNVLYDPEYDGYIYVFLLFLISYTKDLLKIQISFKTSLLHSKCHSAISGLLYKKSLKLNSKSRSKHSVGQLVTFMTTDLNNIMEPINIWQELLFIPVIAGVALYLINVELGFRPTSVFIIATILVLPINFYLSQKYESHNSKFLDQKDTRIKKVSELFSGIQVLKLYSWEHYFKKAIEIIRKKELHHLKSIYKIDLIWSFTWDFVPILMTALSFIIFVYGGGILTAEKVYVVIQYIDYLNAPMNDFPVVCMEMNDAKISLKRVCEYLRSGEVLEKKTETTTVRQQSGISLLKGDYKWDDSENPNASFELNDINLEIEQGQLIAVIGAVGSGKSSLLQAILGEMPRSTTTDVDQSYQYSGKISYTPQSPWINNTSLKNNIIFYQAEDKKKYEETIKACALHQDIQNLPAKDQTEIGEKGINLSGGQKQRISLARAVYKRDDDDTSCKNDSNLLYLFDDPLSAVDSSVGKHIFDQVLSNENGLLKNKNRIFVTNSLQYVKFCDRVIVMENGRIVKDGFYKDLESDGKFVDWVEGLGESGDEEKSKNGVPSQKTNTEQNTSCARSESEEARLIQNELTNERSSSTKALLSWFKAMGKLPVFMAFLFAMLDKVGGLVRHLILKNWVDGNNEMIGSNSTEYKQANVEYSTYYVIMSIFIIFTSLGTMYTIRIWAGFKAAKNIHESVLNKLTNLPIHFFNTTPIGRILNRFSDDMHKIDLDLPLEATWMPSQIFDILVGLSYCLWLTPWLIVVLVPACLLLIFYQRYYMRCRRQLAKFYKVAMSDILSHYSESFSGITCIRASNLTNTFIDKYEYLKDNYQTRYLPYQWANYWVTIRLTFIHHFVVGCLAFLVVFQAKDDDKFTPATVGLALFYGKDVIDAFKGLLERYSELESNIVGVERIQEYDKWESEKSDSETEFIHQDPRLKNWPSKGQINFINFSTKHKTNKNLILKNLNFSINSAEKIGIVGRTGAGKSTLTVSLFRLIEACEGQIIIDGIDISKVSLRELRSKLTIIPQDPLLFAGDLRYNLDPRSKSDRDQDHDVQGSGHGSDDSKIWQALKSSNLDQFISTLDHKISENGENFSAGQKQLLCLARALLRNSKILILDEATAAIDSKTDNLIQETIKKEFKNCTVLTIAHRLNTVMDHDRILVLDGGEICQFDEPGNLIEDEEGLFYLMWKDAGCPKVLK